MFTGRALPEELEPDSDQSEWLVSEAVGEMQAAVQDASWFCKQMDRNERTRLCWWEGKDGTGKKNTTRLKEAKPWNGAADHEVHLVQEVMNLRNSMRMAAISRSALTVQPMEGTDTAKASAMKTVMRYYLEGAMKSQLLVQGMRAGSWADRYGHSIMYIGWKEERGVEKRYTSLDEVAQLLMQQSVQSLPPEQQESMMMEQDESQFQMMIFDPMLTGQIAELFAASVPGLASRGKAGVKQAVKAIRAIQKGEEACYYASFVRKSAPVWETLIPMVDVFYPAEAQFEDNMDGVRWIGRIKWMSAQQIREQAAILDWDKKWVKEVLENHRGRATLFDNYITQTPWALSGAGVRWITVNQTSGTQTTSESQRNLYQIIEVWDRSVTSDGLVGTYKTVIHADVPDMVARRELMEDWHGSYPFVPFTHEKDEKLLLANRGIPEIGMTPQQAIKAQWDSRTDAAGLSTLPPFTGPQELSGMTPRPGAFLPATRGQIVQSFTIPPPDGRSIEIERSIRASMDRFYGVMSESVPEAVSMLMGQADMDWFLASMSQAVSLTAKLVQQYMPPLKGARITGTNIEFDATPDDVRGSFDFSVKFDVRGLDIKWAKEMLEFVENLLLPLDNKGIIKRGPLLEFGFNVLDPALAQRALMPEDEASVKEMDDERQALNEIFSGGGPSLVEGGDYKTRANVMAEELQKSPDRQQQLMQSPQKHGVFTARLKQLIASDKQYNQNAAIGRTLGEPPLQQPTPAEALLAQLEQMKPEEQQPPMQ